MKKRSPSDVKFILQIHFTDNYIYCPEFLWGNVKFKCDKRERDRRNSLILHEQVLYFRSNITVKVDITGDIEELASNPDTSRNGDLGFLISQSEGGRGFA